MDKSIYFYYNIAFSLYKKNTVYWPESVTTHVISPITAVAYFLRVPIILSKYKISYWNSSSVCTKSNSVRVISISSKSS